MGKILLVRFISWWCTVQKIVFVDLKIFYLPLFWILSFSNSSKDVAYYFDQLLFKMNNKCYQKIEQKQTIISMINMRMM